VNSRVRRPLWAVGLVAIAVVVTGCGQSVEEDLDEVVANDTVEPVTAPPEAPKQFFLPTNCQDILSFDVYDRLTAEPIQLLRGPGSGTDEPVYPDGSPQEELGGISCFFGDVEETMTYTLSIAPVTQENRAGVIDGLLEQKYRVDQTATGVLVYSIVGDEFSTPATYNTLHPDAWYEVLVSPGGFLSFEQAEQLGQAMRDHTYR
jgi:hypothetical protein